MSLRQTIYLQFDVEIFNTEEISQAEQLAVKTDGELYCWKTTGKDNWLEKGLSITDVLGVIILPKGLPAQIDMPDDIEDE